MQQGDRVGSGGQVLYPSASEPAVGSLTYGVPVAVQQRGVYCMCVAQLQVAICPGPTGRARRRDMQPLAVMAGYTSQHAAQLWHKRTLLLNCCAGLLGQSVAGITHLRPNLRRSSSFSACGAHVQLTQPADCELP
jgi:hypothetical protein